MSLNKTKQLWRKGEGWGEGLGEGEGEMNGGDKNPAVDTLLYKKKIPMELESTKTKYNLKSNANLMLAIKFSSSFRC